MSNLKTNIFFDKTFILTEPEEVKKFEEDPKAYLTKIGFFQGLDAFNGFLNLNGEKLDLESEASPLRSFEAGRIVILGHLGIPYQDYCSCVCEVR